MVERLGDSVPGTWGVGGGLELGPFVMIDHGENEQWNQGALSLVAYSVKQLYFECHPTNNEIDSICNRFWFIRMPVRACGPHIGTQAK